MEKKKWIKTKRMQQQLQWVQQNKQNKFAFTKLNHSTSNKQTKIDCNYNWKAEESMMFDAKNLSCLAVERMAVARRFNNNFVTCGLARGEHQLRHPLLVALQQRVIRNGHYGNDAGSWDCDIYGNRAIA